MCSQSLIFECLQNRNEKLSNTFTHPVILHTKFRIGWIKDIFWGLYLEGQTISLKSIFQKDKKLAGLVGLLWLSSHSCIAVWRISDSTQGSILGCFPLWLLLGDLLALALVVLLWLCLLAHGPILLFILLSMNTSIAHFSNPALYWCKQKHRKEKR